MREMLATARVTKPHGVNGYLRLQSFSGETKHLLKLKKIVLESDNKRESFDVEDGIANGNSVLLKLRGIDTPEEGRRYSNSIVWVDRKKAAVRKRKEFYAGDLTGCTVISRNGLFGHIEAIGDHDSGTYVEIQDVDGEMYVLPFSKMYFGKINLRKREIELKGTW